MRYNSFNKIIISESTLLIIMFYLNEPKVLSRVVAVTLEGQQHHELGSSNVQKINTALKNSCTIAAGEPIAPFGVQCAMECRKQDFYTSLII